MSRFPRFVRVDHSYFVGLTSMVAVYLPIDYDVTVGVDAPHACYAGDLAGYCFPSYMDIECHKSIGCLAIPRTITVTVGEPS